VAHRHEGHVPLLKQGFSALSDEMQEICNCYQIGWFQDGDDRPLI